MTTNIAFTISVCYGNETTRNGKIFAKVAVHIADN